MKNRKIKKFRIYNTVVWTLVALLSIYIVDKKKDVDIKEKYMVTMESQQIAKYFAKNHITDNDYGITPVITMGENDESSINLDVLTTTTIDNDKEKILETLREEKDYKFLLNNFYIVDSTTSVNEKVLNPQKLLEVDMKLEKDNSKPQILIYHTHGSEKYSDSAMGVKDDTIVGVGECLKELLEEKGYNVIHDTSSYDVVDGKWNRNAYETALEGLNKILADNPSIEVTIDLHRNSGAKKVVTNINGENVAKIMFFNGVSRTKTGSRTSLYNENLTSNLAFSLQLQMKSMEKYPGFSDKIYLKGYRYNLHIVPKAMLVEVGNDKNTVEEAKKAMIPFSEILVDVID